MQLGSIKTIFDKLENDDFVFRTGFGDPMSYRGFYKQVAFQNEYEISLKEVKAAIARALNESFTGYNGGEWRYDYSTIANLAAYGDWSKDSEYRLEDLVGKMLLQYMLEN